MSNFPEVRGNATAHFRFTFIGKRLVWLRKDDKRRVGNREHKALNLIEGVVSWAESRFQNNSQIAIGSDN
jgi:hypothetical protein